MRHYLARNEKPLIFCFIYLVGVILILTYSLGDSSNFVSGDSRAEYRVYLENIEQGSWHFIPESLVNSCVFVTLLPAYIQRTLGTDPRITFMVFPALFFSLMPAFVYLIARQKPDIRQSLIAAAMILSSFYFLYSPTSLGRIGVALGFMAGTIWAMLGNKWKWGVVFGVLVVLSHYATAFILAGLGVASFVFLLVRKYLKKGVDNETI
jgi:uncharacterized membrane protein